MNSNLHKNHKRWTKDRWKQHGLILSSQEEFEEIYSRVISSTNCELCDKPYKSNQDREMDHAHCIDNKWGWFRNVVCTSCNAKKSDRNQINNTSGYIGISKHYDKCSKQGYNWVFRAIIDGKNTQIKTSTDFDKLVKFADQWKLDNNYNT